MDQKTSAILVIDADAASRNYLSGMLQKAGYTVILAPSGKEGLIAAWKDVPRAIVFDPDLGDMPAQALVTRLRQDRRTARLPLVALSSREDQQESAGLLSAGCNEYMLKTGQSIARLLELLPRLLDSDGVQPSKGGILIAFLSAKGGTGTSSLCANMAMCLGSRKLETRVAVVDLVLPIGSIANLVGYSDRLNVVAATLQPPDKVGPAYFKDHLPRVPAWYLNLLAGSPDPETGNQLAPERIAGLIAAIRDSFDYVFVDLGRSLSRISLPVIQQADLVAVIMSTDLAAVVLTQSVCEYLKNQGVDSHRIYPILNRAVGLEGLTKAEAEKMLGLDIRVTIPYMGGNFTVANNRHEPILTRSAGNTFTLAITQTTIELADTARRLRER